MSFAIPSLADLLDRTRKSFRDNFPGTDAWIWPNNITPTAKVFAGSHWELFGFMSYIAKQPFAYLAPDLDTLIRHGTEFGLSLLPAEPSSGKATFTSTGAATIDSGALLARTDGAQYRIISGATLVSAGSVDVQIIADIDGAAGNAVAGTPLEIVSGVTGDCVAKVSTGGVVGGADVEDIEIFRSRILFRKRNPINGGSPADYVTWATSLSGVTRVFVERVWNGPGTVRVFPLFDNLFTNGIADDANIGRVQDLIDTMAPAGATVTVHKPNALAIDVQITALTPNTTAVQSAVIAELQAAFKRLSKVAGSNTPHAAMPYLATPQSFSRSWLWQAVADATGEERHKITSPADDVAMAAGYLPTLGNVTFV